MPRSRKPPVVIPFRADGESHGEEEPVETDGSSAPAPRSKGGPQAHRSQIRVQSAKLEHDVCELYLQGKYQHEIALKLEVSLSTVKRVMKKAEQRWLAASVSAMGQLRAEELARINALEREWWRAWRKSCKPQEKTSTSKTTTSGSGGNDPRELTRAELRREQSTGDPAYLHGVQWCIDRRCKLLGLDRLAANTAPDGGITVVHGVDVNVMLGLAPEPAGLLASTVVEMIGPEVGTEVEPPGVSDPCSSPVAVEVKNAESSTPAG